LRTSDDSLIDYPPKAFNVGWTILALAGLALIFFVVLIAGSVLFLAQHGFDRSALQQAASGMYFVNVQGVAEVLAIAYILAVLPSLSMLSLREIGFRRGTSRDWGIAGLGIVAMFVVVTVAAGALTNILHFKTPEVAIAIYQHANSANKVLFVLFGVILAPVFEEFVFRIFLFNVFRKWFGTAWGIGLSSILFGLAHWQPPNVPAMYLSITFPLMLGGALLAYVYYRTGKAWASIVTHGAFNAVTFLALTLVPSLAK
jgi:hypothetical protein